MNIDQTIGNRGTDTAFHNLMAISGEAILKLMGEIPKVIRQNQLY
jgi:hypothetical protein